MEAPSRAVPERGRGPSRRTFYAWTLLAAALWAFPGSSLAGAPTTQVRGAIDRTIEILKDPALAAKEKREERRAVLRKEIEPVFDFPEMAKRSLGIHWRGRTPEERDRFVDLFRRLIENTYLGKIESYGGEEIRYDKEAVDGPYAEVKTAIVTRKGQEIPVDYRLLENGGRWRIYDVVIEGISLVNNYRSQFGSILRKSSFSEMLKKLERTVREQKP